MRACSSVRGSIPACAGKPVRHRQPHLDFRVYPRVCGEAVWGSDGLQSLQGLSPRVRGSHDPAQAAKICRGSIPACAGKPRTDTGRPASSWVYPRVCGEATYDIDKTDLQRGLSPRVRGSRASAAGKERTEGSIPACAGKPRCSRRPGTGRRVYPRVCGEASSPWPRLPCARGLSPRVRGSPRHQAGADGQEGSIPACAGKPCGPGRTLQASRVYPRVCGEA